MGNAQTPSQAQPSRYPASARSHIARIERIGEAVEAQPAQHDQPHDSAAPSSSSDSSSDASATAAVSGEPDSVFGPSHPLHPLVSAHLPDVLARLVLSYQSPLLPRQLRYRGHVLLQYGAYGYRDQRIRCMSANPLSLARRSFSWSGWMNRAPSSAARHRDHFLLSFQRHPPLACADQWLFVGYRRRYNRAFDVQSQLFTFAFFGNDLDARLADAEPDTFGTWEHWSGSFDYPRLQTTAPMVSDSIYTRDAARNYPPGTALGRRRLYRNGRLVAEDDSLPLLADDDSRLVVGNDRHRGDERTLDGGVCDVRLYSRVLSEADMRALYDGDEHQLSGHGLEAHWPLDGDKHIPRRSLRDAQSGARVMLDVSGHERHLEMVRFDAGVGMESRYREDGQA